MSLPNPGMNFTPFDPLPASELNDLVENIESLADGSGIGDGAVTPEKLASPVAFFAHPSSAQSMIGSATTNVNFGTEIYDYGDNFASNVFTAPYDGVYNFTASVSIGVERRIFVSILVNSNEVLRSPDGSANRSAIAAGDILLNQGDEVRVTFFNSGTATNNVPNNYVTYFCGHLVGLTS